MGVPNPRELELRAATSQGSSIMRGLRGARALLATLALLVAFGATMRMLGLRAIAVGLLIMLAVLGAGARPRSAPPVAHRRRRRTPAPSPLHRPICLGLLADKGCTKLRCGPHRPLPPRQQLARQPAP